MIVPAVLLAGADDGHARGAPRRRPSRSSTIWAPTTARSRRRTDRPKYFDQGLRLVYGFNHDEAERAFREAARLDPTCAICFWGIGLTLGPNINLPDGPRPEREGRRSDGEGQGDRAFRRASSAR